MPSWRLVLFLSLATAALAAHAAEKGNSHFWRPHSSVFATTQNPVFFQSGIYPWVQQMRNFRDVLRVDAYRATPTPTPTPVPIPPGAEVFVSFEPIENFSLFDFDPTPLHPLDDYFSDVADIYRMDGFDKIADALKHAGKVVENLITKTGRNRFRNARNLARRLERESENASDRPMIEKALDSPTVYLQGKDILDRFYWDDYRQIAWTFAQSLRDATRNSASSRPLARGIPYLRNKLVLTLTYRESWATGRTRIDFSRPDGRGGARVTTLYDSSGEVAPGTVHYSGPSFSFESSSSTLTVTVVGASPTPTPSPTP